jgi:Xaa-Pro aminopeptidase
MQQLDFPGRIEKLQQRLADEGLDLLVATRNGTITYLTGTLAPWRTAVLVPVDGKAFVVTSEYDASRIDTEGALPVSDVWKKGKDGERTFARVVRQQIESTGAGQVGVELGHGQIPGVLTATEYQTLADVATLENAVTLANDEMHRKEQGEIERLHRAAEIADVGMQAAFEAVEPGVSETAVAGAAEEAMRQAGDQYTWATTGTEVGAGRRQSYEDGLTVLPSDNRIERGDMVTIDLHPTYDGYLGDYAMTGIVGDPSDEQRALADAWEAAVDTLLAELAPGAVIADVAEAVEDVVEETGYAEHFFDGYVGHGLGTSARIPPVISASNTATLQDGMVVVGLLYIGRPGVGSMRMEVPIHLTGDGNEVLTSTPIELVDLW